MQREEIEISIKNILIRNMRDFNNNIEDIGIHDELLNYGINSVSFIKSVINIETEFEFEFEDEFLRVDKFPTLNTIIQYVLSRLEHISGMAPQNIYQEEKKMDMKELVDNIGYCGLICKLCNGCSGCKAEEVPEEQLQCFHRKCCIEKELNGCWECNGFPCNGNMFSNPKNIRVRAFVRFMKEESPEKLITCITENEKNGIQYGYQKDYDLKQSEDEVIELLKMGGKNI